MVFLRINLMLVFDPTRPIFNSGLDFIKINIPTKFQAYWIKTIPSRVYICHRIEFLELNL